MKAQTHKFDKMGRYISKKDKVKVKNVLAKSGKSADWLAEEVFKKCKIDKSKIYDFVDGKTLPNLTEKFVLAIILKVSYKDFN